MSNKPSIYENLKQSGLIYQGTNLDTIQDLLDNHRVTFYLGIDPTADSLHIGHLCMLMVFKKLQDAGHQGILLFGGATGMVGDPSGKQDMRQFLAKNSIINNIESIKASACKFVKMDGENPAIISNNAYWFDGLDFITFMREIGAHFNVNKMLSADAYSNRLENGGLTFLEMSYMLMQSYDFVQLNKLHNCTLQIGGSDQWGNIVAGTNLHRKLKFGNDEHNDKKDMLQNIYGLTCPLLLTKDGKKMGKTEKGTLWLDANKTAPYDFYQYFYNVDDADVGTLLRWFSNFDNGTIDEMITKDIVSAKKTMAYELTALVHGKETAETCVQTSINLFSKNAVDENAPTETAPLSTLKSGINISQLCVISKVAPSTSKARQLIESGAIFINNNKITDITHTVTAVDLNENYILVKKGKKTFVKVVFE